MKIPFAEISIAISWKWIIELNNTLLVLHDSILPKYRGHLPLVSQLIDGQEEIGVTAILGNEKYDEGDIVYISKSKIKYPIKIKDAIKIINECYCETLNFSLIVLKTVFNLILHLKIIPKPPIAYGEMKMIISLTGIGLFKK